MIHKPLNLPTFKIVSKVRLLPPNITMIDLIEFSWLKNKKKWKRNKRLRNKFLKSFHKYIPLWVLREWKSMPIYQKAADEIMYEEDKRLLSSLSNEN